MSDHGRHKQAATPASFRSGIPVIRHRVCGGRVWKVYGKWQCGCGQEWRNRIVEAFTESDCETRFYLDGDRDSTAYAIVWVQDPLSKAYHTKLVPAAEAENYPERFTL